MSHKEAACSASSCYECELCRAEQRAAIGPNMQQPCMSNTAGWAWGEWGAGVGAAVHDGESREWTSAVSRSPAGLATSSRRGKAGGVGANATHGPAWTWAPPAAAPAGGGSGRNGKMVVVVVLLPLATATTCTMERGRTTTTVGTTSGRGRQGGAAPAGRPRRRGVLYSGP